MANAKIKKGDTVVVLSGKDKGKSGEVSKVMPKDGKPTRVRFEKTADGKMQRIAVKSGEKVDG